MASDAPPDRPDAAHHLRQVARGGAVGLVGAAVSAVAGFALVVVVANYYSAEDAGTFFSLTSAFLILTATTSLGADTGLGRFMLRYEAQGRPGDIQPTLQAALWPTTALSLVIALALVVAASPVADALGLRGEEVDSSTIVVAALVPFATYNTLALAGTRAFGAMWPTVAIDKILRPVVQPLSIVLVAMSSTSLLWLIVAWSAPYGIAAVVSLVLFRRFMQRRHVSPPDPTVRRSELWRDFWKFTWPRSIGRISQVVIQRADILLVASLRSPAEAAVYTAATRFVALGQFGTQATQQVLQPKFTELLATDDRASLGQVHRVSTAWNIMLAWPMYLAVAVLPYAYLSVFGSEYGTSSAATVVIVMSVGMLVSVAAGPVDTLLLMSGRSTASLVNSLVALAVDIALCLILIPSMGIVGAAVAWATAVGIRSCLAFTQTRRSLRVSSWGSPVAVAMGASLMCFAFPLAIAGLWWQPGVLGLLLLVAGCVPGYAAALWWGRRQLLLRTFASMMRGRARPRE